MCLALNKNQFLSRRYPMHGVHLKIVSAILVVAIFIVPYSKQGLAQESPEQQQNVSEGQMRAFAKVYVEIDRIRQFYEPQVKEAKDPEEAKAVEKEAISKMHEALMKEGLTEESYVQIFQMARTDEGLRTKLLELINAEMEKR
jgi:hypothetical protein